MSAPHAVPDAETLAVTSKARRLGDWIADPDILRPPRIVLPHVAVEGRVTLLSGREKVGKSELLGSIVTSGSLGADVLGVALPAPVTSLWYAIDEPVADAVRRFDRLGADRDNIIINDAPRSFPDFALAVAADLAAFPGVDCIVVDTLSRLMATSGVDANASREVEPFLAALVDLLHARKVSAILSYHTGKGGREYRGSTAIGATVDEVLTLRRRGHGDDDDFDDESADDGRRLLVQDGRNLRGRVHLTRADGVYRIFEDAMPAREKIVNALRTHGTVTGRSKLAELANVRKQAGLAAVAELIESGAIVETGRLLKLSGSGGSGLQLMREPRHSPSGSPGSHRFPEGGTAWEPTTGTDFENTHDAGSHNGNPHLAEVGTGAPRPFAPTSLPALLPGEVDVVV